MWIEGVRVSRRKEPFAVVMGTQVQKAMDSLGLSQVETARQLGIDIDTFGGAVRGYARFSYEVLIELPRVLHRSLYYFLGLDDPSGLTEDEQELLSLYRMYKTPQMKKLLREDAHERVHVERELVPNNAA